MTYWVNVYEGGHPGTIWSSLKDADVAAGPFPRRSYARPLYRIKVTLKGKA